MKRQKLISGSRWCGVLWMLIVLCPGVVMAHDPSTGGSSGPTYICGNGVVEGAEQCDLGQGNSDTRPNVCRSSCELPSCGDGTVDRGEECDDYDQNSNRVPDACRKNCKKAHCGDGVIDEGEQCEDGNNNPHDGCHQCLSCVVPKDNLVISTSSFATVLSGDEIRLCPGRYEFSDQGAPGILVLSGNDYTFDCQDATLVGLAPDLKAKVPAGLTKSLFNKETDRLPSKSKRASKTDSQQTVTTPPGSSGASQFHQGVGIVVSGSNIVVKNCRVEGFKVGMQVTGHNAALIHNRMCNNTTDIRGESPNNYGILNRCQTQFGWEENGQEGCMEGCN